MAQRNSGPAEIDILRVTHGRFDACILGTTPLILNRMSDKAMRTLLQPSGKKNAAQKASTAKHDPIEEFRASAYQDKDAGSPALLQHLSSAFKGAIAEAALDLPGANKKQIGRLTWVVGERIHIFGAPKIFCAVTRNQDMNKTPDVRTRVIVPEWACRITVAFVTPLLKDVGVANLLASAGVTQGVGDWRTGKGKGTYGSFELVNEDNPEWRRRMKVGRKEQEKAMANPLPYDEDTEELLAWWQREMKSRGFTTSATANGHAGARA
jgi:hypothetical protein